jgi:hypothetical protein
MPFPAIRWFGMAFSTFGDTWDGQASCPPGRHTIKPGHDSITADHSSLLAEYRCQLDHSRPVRGRAVDPLLVAIQANAGSIEFDKDIRHVEAASAQPINGP